MARSPKVLIDTVVWVHHLYGKEPYRSVVSELLRNHHQIATHPFIYGEILLGDNGSRAVLLQRYQFLLRRGLPQLPHKDVVDYVRKSELCATSVGWVDANLLASAHYARCVIYTADKYLKLQAERLELAYIP